MLNGRRLTVVAGLLCYALVLFALFTYLKFPSQQVRTFVLTTLRQHGVENVDIGSVQPLLPAGLTFNEVRLSYEVNGQMVNLMHFPQLKIWLHTLQLFTNPRRMSFAGGLYNGSVLGTIAWKNDGQNPMVDLDLQLQELQPVPSPLVTQVGKLNVEAHLAGALRVQLSSGLWQDADGHLSLQGGAGSVAGLEVGGFRLPSLAYDRLAGEFTFQHRQITVEAFQVQGREWQIEGQGNITLHQPLQQSPLDLNMRIHTSDGFERQLGVIGAMLKQRRDSRGFAALKIGGTVERPSPVL